MAEQDRHVAGRYRLVESIGRGAMGQVWRAHDESLDRMVALKELLPHGGIDPADAEDAKERVMREGRIAARVQHPHAVGVYSVVEDEGRPWLVMEYLSSRSLATILDERGSLPAEQARRIGAQVAAALEAAHAVGIVHRDVKPGNVLIAEDGTAKLTDFGISRTTSDGTVTATGDIAGTPAFFAPEVARGEHATFASDVFSLGATLYNAVEGTPPFGSGENQIALLYRVASGTITPAANAGPLTPVLDRLLATAPASRPVMATAREALEAAGSDPDPARSAPGTMSMTPAPAVAPAGKPGRRATVVLSVVTLLALAGVLTTALTVSGDDTHQIRAATSTDSANSTPRSTSGTGPTSTSEPAVTPSRSSTTAAPSTTATPRDTSTPGSTDTGPAVSPEQALRSYYARRPGNLRAGYARLTERFKTARGLTFAQYRRFWQQMAEVRISDVQPRGGNRVAATLTYVYPDGRTTTERNVYALVPREGGWAINSQSSL